jgi:UDP-GlcNAc:undecaprenyl-phosphate GlcNAc-1-phosphate transferase
MISILISFFCSFSVTLLIIHFKHIHQHYSADNDFSGPQKIHSEAVPRIGGISIGSGILFATLLNTTIYKSNTQLLLLLCSIPAFAIGLSEDLTKRISVRIRLFFTAISAILAILVLKIQIESLGIPYLDSIFTITGISLLFTIFAITGLANAYNIIDGFNGLASMNGIITLLAISYVSFLLNDQPLMHTCLVISSAILGFFIWNYPAGRIFLGDGGAYLIGFFIALLSIMMCTRHNNVSPWFPLLINAYPVIETIFTIYRRKVHKNRGFGTPDGIHLHTLIYKRVIGRLKPDENILSANARTSPCLWLLSTSSIIPAILWWQSTPILIAWAMIFTALYIYIYNQIVRFNTKVFKFY